MRVVHDEKVPELTEPRDIAELEKYLRIDSALHLYELGDLDPFFFEHTRWLAHDDDRGRLGALALLYTGAELPVLLAFKHRRQRDEERMVELLKEATSRLPKRFYAHLSPGLEKAFGEAFEKEDHGAHIKMVLARPGALEASTENPAMRMLGPGDLDAARKLYEAAYPEHWFDARMLQTECYVGAWEDDALSAIAGVHVVSRDKKVAALGNIATHPDHRRKGLAKRAVSALCRKLEKDVDHIGLNVKADNQAAIALYSSLGFEKHADYGEWMLKARSA